MIGKSSLSYLTPSWSAPACVKAYVSTRQGGVSEGEFGSLNLGGHVGDEINDVKQNRQLFSSDLAMPNSIVWLNQVHGTNVVVLPSNDNELDADAAVTAQIGQVCAVLTADCLPVFFCNKQGTQVGVAHAGWRSLCSGVLENTLKHFSAPSDVLVWFGPAIGSAAFEVGEDVRDAFITKNAEAEAAFVFQGNGKWLADLYLLARQRLSACGVAEIYGGDCCTYQDQARFFSYRRDGKTGRMASVIWLDDDF